MVSVLSARFKIPPLTVTATLSAITVPVVELAWSNVNVPADTVVRPV